MKDLIYRSLALSISALGIGLILNAMTIGGIIGLSSGIGLWMADFHLGPAEANGGRRLVAKGSPALLLLPLMLAAGQLYAVTTDSLVAQFGAEHEGALASDARPAPVGMLLRML
jgi:hypothetical protein